MGHDTIHYHNNTSIPTMIMYVLSFAAFLFAAYSAITLTVSMIIKVYTRVSSTDKDRMMTLHCSQVKDPQTSWVTAGFDKARRNTSALNAAIWLCIPVIVHFVVQIK